MAMNRTAMSLVFGVAVLLLARPVAADVFQLANGGRIEGRLVNANEKAPQKYVIDLPTGGQITLDAAQVVKVEISSAQTEYEKIRPQFPDTIDGQWKLAEWCRDRQLTAERKKHLQRIIELDPNHAEARRLLGYAKINGRWTTQSEGMAKDGYVFYKGRWRLPQEIELEESKRKLDLAEKDWFQKIRRWRGWLGSDREKQARESFAAIDDPAAVGALAKNLKSDASHDARVIYIEALARIGTPEAALTLAAYAIDDPVEEIRLTCLDHLQKTKNRQVVEYFIRRLRDKDNATINHAAIGLSKMKDPVAVGPLIEALVSVHKQKVGSGNPGQMSMSFPTGGTKGGGGMSAGGGPKIVYYPMRNQAVLDALVTLTSQNFNFNQQQWRSWYAAQKKMETVDTRRN